MVCRGLHRPRAPYPSDRAALAPASIDRTYYRAFGTVGSLAQRCRQREASLFGSVSTGTRWFASDVFGHKRFRLVRVPALYRSYDPAPLTVRSVNFAAVQVACTMPEVEVCESPQIADPVDDGSRSRHVPRGRVEGFQKVEFPNPLFPAATVRTCAEALQICKSKKYLPAGIVTFKHVSFNEKGQVVRDRTRVGMVLKKGAGSLGLPAAPVIGCRNRRASAHNRY